ncbi:hypothetical protein L3Q82_007984 [Scortum barcoo]|uniref:Uncharacterized protein n=1 Tax=Scortum barcoo TaxID=214431 RepID=A0ACB8WKD5_9TELE|nr:hypothetical protein L3Q82_007984 [Scortum barcoo]
MEICTYFGSVHRALLLVVLLSVCVRAEASPDQTKTVEFNVKPGGVVHTFSERVGKSYLFFTQFKVELKGTKIEYANAYSQTATAGQSDVPLKPEEFIIGDSTVDLVCNWMSFTDISFIMQIHKKVQEMRSGD